MGGDETTIIVDSGAEENVCPRAWGRQLGLSKPREYRYFRSANGCGTKNGGKMHVVLEMPF